MQRTPHIDSGGRALHRRRAEGTIGGPGDAMTLGLLLQGTVALSAVASPVGPWRAVLDLVGGALPFRLQIEPGGSGWRGKLCNGNKCEPFSSVRMKGDSVVLEIADYDATVTAHIRADSLV